MYAIALLGNRFFDVSQPELLVITISIKFDGLWALGHDRDGHQEASDQDVRDAIADQEADR